MNLESPAGPDHSRYAQMAQHRSWFPRSNGVEICRAEETDSRSLLFWLARNGPRALELTAPHLARAELAEFVSAARGIGFLIGLWQCWFEKQDVERGTQRPYRHYTSYRLYGSEFTEATRGIFALIDQRVGMDWRRAIPELREVWLRYGWMAFDGQRDTMPAETRDRLSTVASFELARLRDIFRRAHETGAAQQFEALFDHYTCCVHLAYDLGSLWNGLKPLLLALRALSVPALTRDLRFWSEPTLTEHARIPWSIVPNNIIGGFHFHARREQESDERLVECRAHFARFCLDRLVHAKTDRPQSEGEAKPLVEPSSHWRECYVRAVRSLQINPEARGHRALYWSAGHDPDENVRLAAKQAHDELRQQPDLPKEISPRRAIVTALWWLQQAHLLALDIQPDPDGAQRTLAIEVRRTTEAMNEPAN